MTPYHKKFNLLSKVVRCGASQKRPPKDSTNSTALGGLLLGMCRRLQLRQKFANRRLQIQRSAKMPSMGSTLMYVPLTALFVSGSRCLPYNSKDYIGRKANNIPAATAEPITPATLGPIACIKRKLDGFSC